MNDTRAQREAFVRMYGPIGYHLPEGKWLARFGVFIAGWQEALAHYRARAAEVGSNVFVSERQGVPESPGETEHA